MWILIEELSVFIGLTLYEKQSFPLVLCWSVKEQLDFFLVFTALDCKTVRFSSLKTHEENCGRILVKREAPKAWSFARPWGVFLIHIRSRHFYKRAGLYAGQLTHCCSLSVHRNEWSEGCNNYIQYFVFSSIVVQQHLYPHAYKSF